jgi:hypothetical protein
MGFTVVIPTPVVAQVHRGGRRVQAVDRVLDTVDRAIPTSERIARVRASCSERLGPRTPSMPSSSPKRWPDSHRRS